MLQYMSKYLSFNDFNYGGNVRIRDNAALANIATSSSKRPSIDFQGCKIFTLVDFLCFSSQIIVSVEIFYFF